MNLNDIIDLLRPAPAYGTGALRDDPDYRDIPLGAFQPKGLAPASYALSDELIARLKALDQGSFPSCVPHAIAHLRMLYDLRRGAEAEELSARFGYKLCKIFDGRPDVGGTYPRVGALVAARYGIPTAAAVPNRRSGRLEEYRDVAITPEAYADAQRRTFPGFAFATLTPQGIMDAISQNGAICAGLDQAGAWEGRAKPVKGSDSGHYVLLYGYETLPDGDLLVRFLNSWGRDWPRKPRKWPRPGRGEFLWSEYGHMLHGAIAFADVPANLIDNAKNMPYRFTRELGLGDTHPAVRELQRLLNEEAETAVALDGPGSKGQETPYFGPATAAALTRWQTRKGIKPTGYFGPVSLARANERVPKISLIDALIMVESTGDDHAIGDRNLANKAYGPLQIRKPYVDDVNRILGTSYRAEDCLGNRALSIKMFMAYMGKYEPNGTDEEKARCHNGGPGWRKKRAATDGYWSKVRALLQR